MRWFCRGRWPLPVLLVALALIKPRSGRHPGWHQARRSGGSTWLGHLTELRSHAWPSPLAVQLAAAWSRVMARWALLPAGWSAKWGGWLDQLPTRQPLPCLIRPRCLLGQVDSRRIQTAALPRVLAAAGVNQLRRPGAELQPTPSQGGAGSPAVGLGRTPSPSAKPRVQPGLFWAAGAFFAGVCGHLFCVQPAQQLGRCADCQGSFPLAFPGFEQVAARQRVVQPRVPGAGPALEARSAALNAGTPDC